jgi:ankyrin repeat protein
MASSNGHSKIVEILLNNNANINIKNNFNEDSLIAASKNCHYDVIKLLKDEKKLIISKDILNKSAYDNAKDSKCDGKVLDLLKP